MYSEECGKQSSSGAPLTSIVIIFLLWKSMVPQNSLVTNLQTCSPMDPLQWMGAVRMRVQAADKHITIIHTTPVLQLTSCAVKRCVFVINNASLRLLNFKLSILAKIWVHNTEKVHLLLSTYIKIHPHICLELFWLVYSVWSVHISLLIQTRQLFHWRKCYYGLWICTLSWWICFLQTHSFSLHKILTDGLECDVFISCLDSHSDGTHSLQSIHRWASDVMQHFSSVNKLYCKRWWLYEAPHLLLPPAHLFCISALI